jgi:hypothetical protein
MDEDCERVAKELIKFDQNLVSELDRLIGLLDDAPYEARMSAYGWIDKIRSALGRKVEFTTDETLQRTLYLLQNNYDY